jgi:molybdopterin-guanine dinucleotide biosynthesis protein A
MNPKPIHSAAILAGGRATRFGGRDKSALLIEGRPILERQIHELSQITSDILIVGGNPSARTVDSARNVADQVPGCGPLGGLHAALTDAHGEATIVVACDMPYVSASLLRHLLGLTRGADAVVPRTEDGYHPLCAAYTPACIKPIARRLAEGRLKMTDLFDDVRVCIVTAEEIDAFGDHRRLLANVNTPAEYRSIGAAKI